MVGAIDLRLYLQVLGRHGALVAAGVIVTIALAFLSYVRVSPEGLAYRSPQVWSNQSTLVLTQAGAPELRSVLPTGTRTALADTGRLTSLIDVYVAIATSDAVVRDLRRTGVLTANDLRALPFQAAAVSSAVPDAITPMMTITGSRANGAAATKLTVRATQAFLRVVEARQAAAKIPLKDRIQVRIVKSSRDPYISQPRSKALLMVVLLGGLIATAAAAFARDNVTAGKGVTEENARPTARPNLQGLPEVGSTPGAKRAAASAQTDDGASPIGTAAPINAARSRTGKTLGSSNVRRPPR